MEGKPEKSGEFILSGNEDNELFKIVKSKFPGEKFSNPTMELFALLMTVSKFEHVPNAHITIHQDYSGAINFGYLWSISSGKPRAPSAWKAKIPYIVYLVDIIEQMCKLVVENGGSVSIVWVPGHSGNVLNDKADALAKSRKEYFFSSLCAKKNELKSNHKRPTQKTTGGSSKGQQRYT